MFLKNNHAKMKQQMDANLQGVDAELVELHKKRVKEVVNGYRPKSCLTESSEVRNFERWMGHDILV